MTTDIVIEMMTQDFILWRCLHDGPLSVDTIDRWAPDTEMPWVRYRARNKPLILKLTQIYGSCSVLARRGDSIIGQLRFYPKAVWEMEGAGFLCLQQDFPAGPSDDFHSLVFPPREKLDDQTLKVHCLMIGSPGEKVNPHLRKGIGTRMARRLIEWAKENGWKRIEADAFEDLPVIYQVTGSTGREFWEKLGFHVADRFPHPHLRGQDEFVKELEDQAIRAGIDTEKAKDCIFMRLDLAE
jgi:hypothetical protein